MTSAMITPYSGPMEKDPIKAGRSDRSILMKDGMSGTEKSNCISTMETALSIAEITRYLVLFCAFVCVPAIVFAPAVLTLLLMISALLSWFRRSEMPGAMLFQCEIKTPGTFSGLRALHRDLTSSSIRTIPLVPESHRFGCRSSSRTLPPVGSFTPP